MKRVILSMILVPKGISGFKLPMENLSLVHITLNACEKKKCC